MTAFEASARMAKATRMAAVLIAHGADSRTTMLLPEAGRRMVAELAGCRLPSDATWAVVVDLLRAEEAFAAA